MRARPPIRTLLTILVAVVLAATLLILGYVAMLSLRQRPVDGAPAAPLSTMPELPEPDRLPRRPSFVPAAAAGSRAFPPTLQGRQAVVAGLRPDLRESASLFVYDGLGMHVARAPLAGLPLDDAGIRVAFEAPTGQALQLVVAGDEETARTGYWARLLVDADAPADAPLRIEAVVQDVTLELMQALRTHSAALRLRRIGDEDWLPRAAFVAGNAPDEHGMLRLRLGAGRYEARPHGDDAAAPILLTVPGPDLIRASFNP